MNKIYQQALEALNDHQVIAFPTETVFGLGVFYDDQDAYELLNKIKRRREDKPYTMMLSKVEDIDKYAFIDNKYRKLINKFMPGSLTILVKSKDNVPGYVTHNTGIIGIRIPSNKEALELLNYVKKPLLVPSANRADRSPARTYEEVITIFGDEIKVVVPGQIESGEPSTIIDLTGPEIKVIRKGPISLEQLSLAQSEKSLSSTITK
ncbi:MAG: threonylcarbamoyl-AMP synthase [Bacilli bacterium]|nr:threonylcarbamoyl-AMP synthase [Bacilli bacterium]